MNARRVAALAALALAAACGGYQSPPGLRATPLPSTTAQPVAGASASTTTRPSATASSAAVSAAEIARAANDVPPAIQRTGPAAVRVDLETKEAFATLGDGQTYRYWTFGGTIPGPFVRVRVGDQVELHLRNAAESQMSHSIDLHAVTGPGGGSGATQTLPGKGSMFSFKALNPGLYVYHCATNPIPMHIANGMYGLILVEPQGGLPKVDREFYVMQGELYTDAAFGAPGLHAFNQQKMNDERPDYVLFNGRVGALTATARSRRRSARRSASTSASAGSCPRASTSSARSSTACTRRGPWAVSPCRTCRRRSCRQEARR